MTTNNSNEVNIHKNAQTDQDTTIEISQSVSQLWEKVFLSIRSLTLKQIKEYSDYFFNHGVEKNIASLIFASKQLIYLAEHGAKSVNIGGTSTCGKNSVAEELSSLTNWSFRDSDMFHPAENIEKMSKGFYLSNEDRVGFLTGIKEYLSVQGRICSCNALTDGFRAFLAGQNVNTILNYNKEEAWKIATPNFGLVQIIVKKPYEVALQQLDDSNTGKAPKRLFNGKPHYINVTRESEETAKKEGKAGFLQNQYDLLGDPDKINPWEALLIDSEDFRSVDGTYNKNMVREFLLKLPIGSLA